MVGPLSVTLIAGQSDFFAAVVPVGDIARLPIGATGWHRPMMVSLKLWPKPFRWREKSLVLFLFLSYSSENEEASSSSVADIVKNHAAASCFCHPGCISYLLLLRGIRRVRSYSDVPKSVQTGAFQGWISENSDLNFIFVLFNFCHKRANALS